MSFIILKFVWTLQSWTEITGQVSTKIKGRVPKKAKKKYNFDTLMIKNPAFVLSATSYSFVLTFVDFLEQFLSGNCNEMKKWILEFLSRLGQTLNFGLNFEPHVLIKNDVPAKMDDILAKLKIFTCSFMSISANNK